MTRRELELKLWEGEVNWFRDYRVNKEQLYTPDNIVAIINDEAYEIELDYVSYEDEDPETGNMIVPTMETDFTINQISWMNYSDNIWHWLVNFDEFCKEFNIV